MDLSIIVVSYQGLSLLQSCMESIEKNLGNLLTYEIWVIDNASIDGTPEWLRDYAAKRPQLNLYLNNSNVGFAKANNQALKKCSGEFVLLLNNDAYLQDDSLLHGLEFLREHPNAFGCGGLLLNPDGSRGVSYGYFPSPKILTREIIGRKFGQLRAVIPTEEENVHPIDFPCGAFFLIQRKFLDSVGLMDERFFLYFEETDWALQAWKNGHDIYYLPACKAMHVGGGSSEKQRPLPLVATFYESWFLYLRKHSTVAGIFWVAFLLSTFFSYHFVRACLRTRNREPLIWWNHIRGLIWGGFGKPSTRLVKLHQR